MSGEVEERGKQRCRPAKRGQLRIARIFDVHIGLSVLVIDWRFVIFRIPRRALRHGAMTPP
jgi:hypothetical protein